MTSKSPQILSALMAVATCLTQAQAAPAPGDIALSVVARDDLPGFRRADEDQYLTDHMAQTGVKGWRFVAAPSPDYPPRERIEWHFELDPFASGNVRQFFPIPGVQRLFGNRHLITAEAMLYIDDEYQTLMFGQATIRGGAQDPDLAAFINRMTQGLLGEHGAYRSIDMGPAPASATTK
jgi:hypothetical protein